MRNPFFFCKHLVCEQNCPVYRQLTSNSSPPFVLINPISNLQRANLNNEEVLRTDQDPLVITDNGLLSVPEPVSETVKTNADTIVDPLSLFTWFNSHMTDLQSNGGGNALLEYIHRTFFARLSSYRNSVLQSLTRCRAPQA